MKFTCTFIYGYNDRHGKMELWSCLREIADKMGTPCILLGDFNALSDVEDRVGATVRYAEIAPMLECLKFYKLFDVKANRRHFTWNNKQEGDQRALSCIDRVLSNGEWLDTYDMTEVVNLPKGNFNHSPMIVCAYNEVSQKDHLNFTIYGVTILHLYLL